MDLSFGFPFFVISILLIARSASARLCPPDSDPEAWLRERLALEAMNTTTSAAADTPHVAMQGMSRPLPTAEEVIEQLAIGSLRK